MRSSSRFCEAYYFRFSCKKGIISKFTRKAIFPQIFENQGKAGPIRPKPSPVGLIIMKVEKRETERAKVKQRKRQRGPLQSAGNGRWLSVKFENVWYWKSGHVGGKEADNSCKKYKTWGWGEGDEIALLITEGKNCTVHLLPIKKRRSTYKNSRPPFLMLCLELTPPFPTN